MSVLKIIKIGHPVLRSKTRNVSEESLKDPKFRKWLKDMTQTMRKASGVGLAANQVASDLRVFVMEYRANKRYPGQENIPLAHYINPRITAFSREKETDLEGCLSIPGYRGLVPRAREVTFEAWTPEGERVRRTVSGFHARIIQHEVDHLDGFFYMDRMTGLEHWRHTDELHHDYPGLRGLAKASLAFAQPRADLMKNQPGA